MLRLRRLVEQREEREVAEAQRRLNEARVELEARRRARDEVHVPIGRTDAARLRALQLSGISTHEQIEAALEEQRRTEQVLDDARARWANASARRKSAERLDDRRSLEARAAALAASHKSLDELVALRHTAGRDGRR